MSAKKWTLVGKKIKEVRSMTNAELASEGWVGAPTVIVLTDGTRLFASRDDEGNGPGKIFGIKADGEGFGLA